MTTDTLKVFEKIQQSAKETANNTDVMIRVVSITDQPCFRQGDIYVTKIDANTPRGKEIQDRQLAPGNTKGSRHIVRQNPKVRIFENTSARRNRFKFAELMGPIIVADERFVIEHPEHRCVSFPSGVYEIGYQLDERTKRRVMD